MASAKNDNYWKVLATGQVARSKIVRKMKSISADKNIYLAAPSGYGKTVVASQWLASVKGNRTKLILDSEDNIPGYFYRRLVTALQKIAGGDNPVREGNGISFDRLLETIKNLPENGKRCYLVLDDIHMISNEDITKHMPILMQRSPGYICWCLINRYEPTEALMKTGLFKVISKEDLRFSPEEIESLGIEKGIELNCGQIAELREKTEGWVIYLLALLSGGNVPEEIQNVNASLALTQYLEARIWDQMSHELKTLLLSLAVPEEINPELCERLTGRKNGSRLLEEISKDDNAFLSLAGTGKNIYRFHELFRSFLLERAQSCLGEEELRRLNDIAGDWYFKQGEYFEGARHYINNRDHEGIARCLSESYRFLKDTAHMSVEVKYNFAKQYMLGLSPEFISENLYLLARCAVAAFHDGDKETFFLFLDMLYKRLPEIISEYPDLMQTAMFVFSLDFRNTILDCCTIITQRRTKTSKVAPKPPAVAHISSITQNLPFIHRSMRDHSEFHELKPEDLELLGSIYGPAIGKDYEVMKPAIIAGIYYERGDMVEAMRYAMVAYNACSDEAHPESYFCANMILAAVFYVIGAKRQYLEIMEKLGQYVENEAQFLLPNYKAMKVSFAISSGDSEAAREWLDIYAYKSSGRLPFFRICRYFTTMRSYIALDDYASAIEFGRRVQTLADDYKRPLDQIESRLIIAKAIWYSGNNKEALSLLEQAVNLAMPYNFTQLFVNEGDDMFYMLQELNKKRTGTKCFAQFTDRLIEAVRAGNRIDTDYRNLAGLTRHQCIILSHLDSGMSYGEIAAKTGTTLAAVKYHILAVYKKLGVHNAREAILKAKKLKLME